jgi:hypothetical protein
MKRTPQPSEPRAFVSPSIPLRRELGEARKTRAEPSELQSWRPDRGRCVGRMLTLAWACQDWGWLRWYLAALTADQGFFVIINAAAHWIRRCFDTLICTPKRSRRREKTRCREALVCSPLSCEALDARLALSFAVLPPGEPNPTYGDFGYSPWYSGVEITNYTGTSKDLVIPESINGLTVYSVQGIFNNVVTSVVLPSTIKSIWEDAFRSSPALKSIYVDPGNATYQTVDGVLFTRNLAQLEAYPRAKEGPYSIPTTVQRIRAKAFQFSANLTRVTVPSSVQEIGRDAFSFCPALRSVVLQDGIKVVDYYAFAFCRSLKRVSLPSSIVDIRDYAFYACSNLTRIQGPATLATNLNATPTAGGGVRVTWQPPAFAGWKNVFRTHDGALTLLGYRIEVSADAGRTWRESAIGFFGDFRGLNRPV